MSVVRIRRGDGCTLDVSRKGELPIRLYEVNGEGDVVTAPPSVEFADVDKVRLVTHCPCCGLNLLRHASTVAPR